MVDAAPFAGVRYDPQVAGDVTATSAPSYDDLDPVTYARHREASPYTVLELLAGRVDERGYTAAGATLARWRRTGVLRRDPRPAMYLYEEHELRDGVPAVQRGLLAAVKLEPLDGTGAVLPHEAVHPERVEGRLERLAAAPIDVAPVFALYRDPEPELSELLARPPQRPPIVAFTDEAGVDHRVWALDDPDDIATARRGLAPVRAVIADGHHRYAAALAYAERMLAGPHPAEPIPPWQRTLMYLVDVEQHGPQILPIHRVLEGVRSFAPLDELFERRPGPPAPRALAAAVERSGGEAVGLITADGSSHLLLPRDQERLRSALPPDKPAAWRMLEAALIDHVVVPALAPTRVTPNPDVQTAAAQVRGVADSALVVLPPVPAGVAMDLAMAGALLPPKTTWFRPKPRMGLILRDVLGSCQQESASAPD